MTYTLNGFLHATPRRISLRVWCDWCCVWHQHGTADDTIPGSEVHRVAHCYAPDSPYRNGGYTIRISKLPFETVQHTIREASYSQQLRICDATTTPGIEKLRQQPIPIPGDTP